MGTWFQTSLFNRLGILVIVFTITLTATLFYQFEYSFTTQDSILDAHEHYYYSKMVESWGSPPDTNKVKKELTNLKIWCGIYNKEVDHLGTPYPGKKYWSNLPDNIHTEEFIGWVISTDYKEMYNIDIPHKIITGDIYSYPSTVVDIDDYLFYLVIDYLPPSEWYNIVFATVLAIIFILGLYFFIRHYLKPVQLMKNRIKSLEKGDLKSKVDILGSDELADLSLSMNKMIAEISILLDNKHQLLLEVSHELRSPLARMQFLIEMLPEHKNNVKLREEINFLEGMIDNLLLSDKLSEPYSQLELIKIQTSELIEEIMNLFPSMKEKISIINSIPNEFILVDKTKFIIAIRNLLDNSLKYGRKNKIELLIEKKEVFLFIIRDFGVGISSADIPKITDPFFQIDQSVTNKGFGLGLTICKKIIESHKGHLEIKSVLGKGSEFILHLPII